MLCKDKSPPCGEECAEYTRGGVKRCRKKRVAKEKAPKEKAPKKPAKEKAPKNNKPPCGPDYTQYRRAGADWCRKKRQPKAKEQAQPQVIIPEEVLTFINTQDTMTQEQKNTAYKKLALKYHPDRNPRGNDIMAFINRFRR
jgi:hypothetical protein